MQGSAVIVAAGRSVRFGGETPKQFLKLAGQPLLAWTLARFEAAQTIDRVLLVVPSDQTDLVAREFMGGRFTKLGGVIGGGDIRRQSVLNGLEALPESTVLVAIHDGARPLVRPEDIDSVMAAAGTDRAAILAKPVSDTIKRVAQGAIVETVDRSLLYQAQTPQAFDYRLILEAHRRAAEEGIDVTDDAVLIEQAGGGVKIVERTGPNFKITTRHDFRLAEALLEGETI